MASYTIEEVICNTFTLTFPCPSIGKALDMGRYIELSLDRLLAHFSYLGRSHNRFLEYISEQKLVEFTIEFTIASVEDIPIARDTLNRIVAFLCCGKENSLQNLLSSPYPSTSKPPTCDIPNNPPIRPIIEDGTFVDEQEGSKLVRISVEIPCNEAIKSSNQIVDSFSPPNPNGGGPTMLDYFYHENKIEKKEVEKKVIKRAKIPNRTKEEVEEKKSKLRKSNSSPPRKGIASKKVGKSSPPTKKKEKKEEKEE